MDDMRETDSPAIADMLDSGLMVRLNEDSLESFLGQDRLTVLFFTGGPKRRRESHDVAVALREVLKDYPGMVEAAMLEDSLEKSQQERFRVLTPPSLVFAAGGRTLEVVPGVRDWADYERAFHRYLGEPAREVNA
jgi:hypothetical protein